MGGGHFLLQPELLQQPAPPLIPKFTKATRKSKTKKFSTFYHNLSGQRKSKTRKRKKQRAETRTNLHRWCPSISMAAAAVAAVLVAAKNDPRPRAHSNRG